MVNKYELALNLLIKEHKQDRDWTKESYSAKEDLQELVDKEEKYRWHDLQKDPSDLPSGREWVLAMFKDDTDFILAPRVADYVGKQTPITTSENWIIIDLDDDFNLSEYHRNLKCIAWKYIDPFKGE